MKIRFIARTPEPVKTADNVWTSCPTKLTLGLFTPATFEDIKLIVRNYPIAWINA